MGFIVVRYSERPALWEGTAAISSEVWPEYNLHREVLSPSWPRRSARASRAAGSPTACSTRCPTSAVRTGMRFPDDGQYTFPDCLAPLEIDHARDLGSYWEPNVWIVHDL